MTKEPFYMLNNAGILILIPPNEETNVVAITVKALNEEKLFDRILELHVAIVRHDDNFTPLLIPDRPVYNPNWDHSPQTMVDEALKRLSHQPLIANKGGGVAG